jgi:hypothetical protein
VRINRALGWSHVGARGKVIGSEAMIPPAHVKVVSDENEGIVEKRFKRICLSPIRLDKVGKRKRPDRKRPDFLVNDGASRPVLICEVKTILSGGHVKDKQFLASTADPDHFDKGSFVFDIDFTDMDNALANAVSKYRELIEDRPELARVPLVVAFFFDFFADHFDLYRADMDRFKDVAGILKVERDHVIDAVASKMSQTDLEARCESKSMAGMPPNTKVFRLLKNTCARLKLPRDFVARCITA